MPAGISGFLRHHQERILRAWEEAVRAEAQRVELTDLALRDSIPALLAELADWLAGDDPPGDRTAVRESIRHVLDRLDQGFDLRQLLREFRLLREAILRVVLAAEADEQAWEPCTVGRATRVRELARLNAGLDVAASNSVEHFVDERDRRAREERERANAALRASEARNAFLRRLGDALRPLADPLAIQLAACRLLAERLATDRAYYVEVDEREGVARVERDFVRGDLPSIAGVYRLQDYGWTLPRLREGETIDVEDVARNPLIPDADRAAMAAVRIASHVSVPILKAGGVVGAFCVTESRPRRWSDEEVALVRETAELLWASIVRARAEERLRADLSALTRMHELGARVAGDAGVEALLQEALDVGVAVTGADQGTLQLLEGDALRVVAQRGDGACPAPEETLGRGDRVVIPDVERRPGLGTAALQALRAGGVRALQATPLRTRSGRLLGILSTSWRAPHTPDEHTLRRLDLLVRQTSDLVELKQSEEQRTRAVGALEAAHEELKAADRNKSEFLAMLSHELRNPLAPIRTSTYVLEHAAPESDAAGRAREVIRRQAEHLTRLVDDLLDVTRISRGKLELHRQLLDLRDVVQQTVEDSRALFERAQVELVAETGAVPAWIEADPTRLSQVIGNLLHNAQKFTPAGGRVTVRLELDGGEARLRIRDTGAGMEPGRESSMFEPFAQGEQTMARTQGGLGLGLSLVKSLVELHGGTVAAHSDGRGLGAEFTVALPLAARADEANGGTRARVGAPRDILIIEDNADSARTLADLLTLEGHEVRIAPDGRSGLTLARERAPEVILCDVGLPDMDGYEVARTIRGDGALSRVRLVALTGYAQPHDRRRAREAGFDAHVAKPPDPAVLAGVLGAEGGV